MLEADSSIRNGSGSNCSHKFDTIRNNKNRYLDLEGLSYLGSLGST